MYFCLMHKIKNVVFVGAGKVVFHLAKVFDQSGIEITHFYSRNKETAKQMALDYGANWGDLENIELYDTDLVVVSVPDEALENVLSKLPFSRSLLVHTSGSMDMAMLREKSSRTGVFYPLQTFSKEKTIDFKNAPILLESQNEDDYILLEHLAHTISNKVYKINTDQRKKIHIAAVFSCNFANYMFHIAEDILEQDHIPFEILKPLIAETADKIKEIRPFHAQTGPAMRRDHITIAAHLEELKTQKNYQEIYQLLSKSIIHSRNK